MSDFCEKHKETKMIPVSGGFAHYCPDCLIDAWPRPQAPNPAPKEAAPLIRHVTMIASVSDGVSYLADAPYPSFVIFGMHPIVDAIVFAESKEKARTILCNAFSVADQRLELFIAPCAKTNEYGDPDWALLLPFQPVQRVDVKITVE